ncbi:hypothetical protein [Methylobacterium sp. J-077]|uniref:hypothetical protein n=1 Tax=Methylobacterium sp. J-077 TaxID=2836656 RepID=UPI001FBB703E|nr:hypothetical protein [Methylobacterium sp. J-077]MCJ2126451.1 hypothetical protein [Methylobacterium sp. J-077]
MAFVCTASCGFGLEILGAGPVSVAIINIGHDNIKPLNYTAVIGLDILPGGSYELYVQLVEADDATGEDRLFWSGRDTSFIKGVADRAAVLDAILTGLRVLISRNGPDEFSWFTYDEAMPKKALVKFQSFKEVIEGCGYTVTSSRLAAGRKAWKARR